MYENLGVLSETLAKDGAPSETRNPFTMADGSEPRTILNLHDEMVELVGRAAVANSPRDALRLCQACQALRAKLGAVRAAAEARRLIWLPGVTHKRSNHGRTLTALGGGDSVEPWVVGGPLPTVGRSAWTVRVDRSRRDDGNGMWIGVCDAAARCSWGLFLYSGRLRCISRDADGKIDLSAKPDEGYPNGNYEQVLRQGPFRCAGGATGTAVEVLVDHGAGSLHFRINGGPLLQALPLADKERGHDGPRAFPPGTPLRPYVSCYYPDDQMSFVGFLGSEWLGGD